MVRGVDSLVGIWITRAIDLPAHRSERAFDAVYSRAGTGRGRTAEVVWDRRRRISSVTLL